MRKPASRIGSDEGRPGVGSHACVWSASELGPAMSLLARHFSAKPGSDTTSAMSPPGPTEGWRSRVSRLAASHGLEAEEVDCSLAELQQMLGGPQKMILPISELVDGSAGPRVAAGDALVFTGARGGRPTLVDRRHRPRRVESSAILDHLVGPVLEKPRREMAALLDQAGVPDRRRGRALDTLVAEKLGSQVICRAYLIRLPASAPFLHQLRSAGLSRELGRLMVAYLATVGLFVGSWWMLGKGALSGHVDPGWMIAWLLLLLALVPAGLAQGWSQARLSLGVSALLKRRLLHGALRLDPDLLRPEGSGHLLGRVIESESLARLGLGAGFLAPMAIFELISAAWVMAHTPARTFLLPLLALTLIALLGLLLRLWLQRSRWTRDRLRLTHDLVEKLEGHRTRLVQQDRRTWHLEEDSSLMGYHAVSADLEPPMIGIALASRIWLCLGLAGLLPAFAAGPGGGGGATAMAVALGGILLAQRGVQSLADGAGQLIGAAIAWRQVEPLFRAGAEAMPGPSPLSRQEPASGDAASTNTASTDTAPVPGRVIIEGRDLAFRHSGRAQPVLQGLDLRIREGERILLTGASGSGKSTLVSLLTGWRAPTSGLLLARGLDRASLGEAGWRQLVAGAPQFHDNHIFSETLAFNLLLGRRWPPERDDLQRATALCRELGLGELLQRMPGGLFQMVGDSGWQLSHGERSRIFLARALLQGGELVVLDESTVALDPENASLALACARRHARTLLLVAHP